MRRADRLFQIVQFLRHRRVVTAARLAERFEVSERTIYRDIRDLVLSGVPVRGEAGVGYALPRDFDLPPLMFTEEEIEALVLGARIVRSWADPALARSAEDALGKIETVLPDRLRMRVEDSTMFALNFQRSQETTESLALLRRAIRNRAKVRFEYLRTDGERSSRTVRPLCLAFMAPNWLFTGWCELRCDFRSFRVDRISDLSETEERFQEEPGRALRDFIAMVSSKEDP